PSCKSCASCKSCQKSPLLLRHFQQRTLTRSEPDLFTREAHELAGVRRDEFHLLRRGAKLRPTRNRAADIAIHQHHIPGPVGMRKIARRKLTRDRANEAGLRWTRPLIRRCPEVID